jgi:CRP-like cAMP-binding protein
MIFDYGDESNYVYIVVHGEIDVMIPNLDRIVIDDDR